MNNKVLIVDDHGKNIQVLANLLTSAHYQIEYALSGKAAIQWVEKENFDIILLDIMMPEMDGFETCVKIKELPGQKDVPVIFLTARDDTDSITKAFSLGGVDYLTKPFNQDELLVRIATHLELKNNREKLLNTNKWLEKEVNKKTIELQKANIELSTAYLNLKSLDQAQNEFLKSISHEIRTPLNGIVGSLGLLKNYNTNDELDEVIHLLELSVHKLEKYSFSALQIAYLRLKGLDLQSLQEININAIMKNCINEQLANANAKNIEFRFKSNKSGVAIKGDFDLINSALKALIESSVIFTNKGYIDISIIDFDDVVECTIEDDGALFSSKTPIYMFDSINSKSAKYERNASMELHLAQIIVLSHNGSIDFRNKDDNKGTVISIKLNKKP
jgi:two-component system sensor histidine kinase/response regulator